MVLRKVLNLCNARTAGIGVRSVISSHGILTKMHTIVDSNVGADSFGSIIGLKATASACRYVVVGLLLINTYY